MSAKPFRFAVQSSSAPDAKAWRELAHKSEDLGYSTLYVPDHFGDQWGPIVALTVAAEATTKLNVGSLVFDNDYRHPVVLAKEIATLDLVSEGRVEFGIGAGWATTDYDESGIEKDAAGVRISRLEEALVVFKALWSEGKATFAGDHYRVTGAQGHPRPASAPHPKIVIGGGGKRVLSLAAREADIVGINPNLAAGVVGPEVAQSAKVERYRERRDWVREAAGSRFEDLELQTLTFMVNVGGDAQQLAEQMAPMFGLSVTDALEVPIMLAGSVEQICETLQRRRDDLGLSYWVVSGASVEAFAPVVERLNGT